ncbi:MAG TPA: VOC family protein [Xanthobacteraceae bacterium]|nr:VOC family protein [Xanthobacteraceae bacterium]
MPSLENLRKQAKLVLRWHRTGYYPVAAQIRAVLPRFAGLCDVEILTGQFTLGDAQELVARQAGYPSWQALKQGFDAMPEQTHPVSQAPRPGAARPVLTGLSAQLFVADIRAACDYYAERLGFSVVFVYGDPPFYGEVKRDCARLTLRCLAESPIDPALRERESLLSATIEVDTADEIKQLFLTFQSAGVDFHQALKHEPWGARDFIVRDPDGNLILFAGPAQ